MPKTTRLVISNIFFAFKFVASTTITIVAMLSLFNFGIIGSAYAQERVYTYSSIIKVLPNRALDVTETITVYVENKKIRHGIYRDFETTRINQDNKKITVGLKIISVRRNGVREKYHTRNQGNKIRVFFGSKDKIVNRGIQTYIFHFVTTNQINAYKNKDEFYWNASGNKWSMPVFRVEATVVLPPKVKQKTINFSAYSGYAGVNKQDYISSFKNNHTIKFALNRKYLAGNGLTIAIGWPKGLIDAAKQPAPVKNQLQLGSENITDKSNVLVALIESITNSKNTSQEVQEVQEILTQDIITTEDKKELQQEPLVNSVNNEVSELELAQENLDKSTPEIQSSNTALVSTIKPKPNTPINTSAVKLPNNKPAVFINYISSLNLYDLIGLIGLSLLLIYFLSIRLYLNKDKPPPKNHTIPENENIPDNLSPASIRYINEMKYDDRTFAIALINIAVKGHIDIINTGKAYKIERRDFTTANKLSNDETVLLNTLMENETIVQLSSENHQVIHDAMTKHKTRLEEDHKNKYFATNVKWFNFAIALIAATEIATAVIGNSPKVAMVLFLVVALFSLCSYAMSYILLDMFNFYKNFQIQYISKSVFYQSARKTKEAYVFAIVLIELTMMALLVNYIGLFNVITIAAAGFVCAIFSDYLVVPNSDGKNILNKIVNLKEFITHGEILHANTHYDSIQLSQKISAFDNYLPYTIALGVESEWGDHYSLLFDHKDNSRNGADDILGYSPHWYHDSAWKENNTTGFCKSLSSKFSFSAASAAKTPKRNYNVVNPGTVKH